MNCVCLSKHRESILSTQLRLMMLPQLLYVYLFRHLDILMLNKQLSGGIHVGES
jgi:hypothetical protein